MKKSIVILFVTVFLTLPALNTASFASTPPPPPPPHGETGDQAGNAPIGSGLIFLLAAAGFYGFKKRTSK